MKKYLTIDVGGTYIKFAVMTEDADILEKGEIPTPMEGLSVFEDTIVRIFEMYKDQDIHAVCMSAPGRINSQTGFFHTSGALKYISGVNLADELKERIPVPFCVENDAKAAALAELWKGSMKGIDSGSVITLGTGIGGSVIYGGKLVRGHTFAAGEFSSVNTHWDQKYDRISIWAYACSATALVRKYAERIGADPAEISGRIFFDRVHAGENEACEVLEDFCMIFASGLMSLQLILDVQRIAIGGGISAQDILIETINRKMDDLFEEYKGRMASSKPEIVACTFRNDANLIGALYHAVYEMNL